MIFPSSFIEVPVVDAHPPTGDSPLRNMFIFLIADNCHSTLLGSTCTGLTHSLLET
jgi:hypothetical protein